ncbi:MAG: alpha/beta hydrolase [Spirochaetes bacterium]|nr:alpha/beta hydrolase [Spirochaetota bacterium]
MIFQSRFIFFPGDEITATPGEINLSYETVNLETDDGVKLSGWFIPARNERGVVLFCHGNAGNISHRLESIQVFHDLGLSTFIFDYRGYGRSEGKISEQGTYLDVKAAWRYLVQERQIEPGSIIIFGRSLGGSIAAWLARESRPKALIIESSFTSIRNAAVDMYPFLPLKILLRYNYSTMDYLAQVKCPVLIVHSRDDELIPFSHGQRLFEIANNPKEFLEISGSHNEGFTLSVDVYEAGLNSFILKHVSG